MEGVNNITVYIHCNEGVHFRTEVRYLVSSRTPIYATLSDSEGRFALFSANGNTLSFADALEEAAREIRKKYYSLIGKEENNAK